MEIQRAGNGLSSYELEEAVNQLKDQVWWLSLPFWRRWLYRLFGYRDPIPHFYADKTWWPEFCKYDLKPLWRRINGG